MTDRETIAVQLKSYYKLSDILVTRVLEYVYAQSEMYDKANDFALAHYLNERAIGLFELIADDNNLPAPRHKQFVHIRCVTVIATR